MIRILISQKKDQEKATTHQVHNYLPFVRCCPPPSKKNKNRIKIKKMKIVKKERNPPLFTSKQLIKF
jgi:hypothetical protein